ncbi:DNA (cytosine-5-)-methyltransferase [Plasmodium inui San Antonio 1]|uniref:DNA (Cytosine-5-)-methyltransferase n=1 Tax=Plasmodium inui San Antonio 1 TaxID=1237626 RepID=W7AEG9_9APIC|nr:DNA (cytosine-5-)-methyltransferase [Plasmodium inui San Antonio 1]EUD67489.1 DNA (cytosine-5-)-methyltransferase [Plasmodium inui San Antonio 1]
MDRVRTNGRRNNDVMNALRDGNIKNENLDEHQFWTNIDNQYFSNFDKRLISAFEDHIKCTDYICNKIKNKKINKKIFQNINCYTSSVKIKLNRSERNNDTPNITDYISQNKNSIFKNEQDEKGNENNQAVIPFVDIVNDIKKEENILGFNPKNYPYDIDKKITNHENVIPCEPRKSIIEFMPLARNEFLLNTLHHQNLRNAHPGAFPFIMGRNFSHIQSTNLRENNFFMRALPMPGHPTLANGNMFDIQQNFRNGHQYNVDHLGYVVSSPLGATHHVSVRNANTPFVNIVNSSVSHGVNSNGSGHMSNYAQFKNTSRESGVMSEFKMGKGPGEVNAGSTASSTSPVTNFVSTINDRKVCKLADDANNGAENNAHHNNTNACVNPGIGSANAILLPNGKNDSNNLMSNTFSRSDKPSFPNSNVLHSFNAENTNTGSNSELANHNHAKGCNLSNPSMGKHLGDNLTRANFDPTKTRGDSGGRNHLDNPNGQKRLENFNSMNKFQNFDTFPNNYPFFNNCFGNNDKFHKMNGVAEGVGTSMSVNTPIQNNNFLLMNSQFDNKMSEEMNMFPCSLSDITRGMVNPSNKGAGLNGPGDDSYSGGNNGGKYSTNVSNSNRNGTDRLGARNVPNFGNTQNNNSIVNLEHLHMNSHMNHGIDEHPLMFFDKHGNNKFPTQNYPPSNSQLNLNSQMGSYKNDVLYGKQFMVPSHPMYAKGFYHQADLMNYENVMMLHTGEGHISYPYDQSLKYKDAKFSSKKDSETKLKKYIENDEYSKSHMEKGTSTSRPSRTSKQDTNFFNPFLNKKYDGVGRLPYIQNKPVPNGLHIAIYIPKNYEFSEKIDADGENHGVAEKNNGGDKAFVKRNSGVHGIAGNEEQPAKEQEDLYEKEALAKLLTEITFGDRRNILNPKMSVQDKERCYNSILDELKNYASLPIIMGNILPYWERQKSKNLLYKVKNFKLTNAKSKYIHIKNVNKKIACRRIRKRKKCISMTLKEQANDLDKIEVEVVNKSLDHLEKEKCKFDNNTNSLALTDAELQKVHNENKDEEFANNVDSSEPKEESSKSEQAQIEHSGSDVREEDDEEEKQLPVSEQAVEQNTDSATQWEPHSLPELGNVGDVTGEIKQSYIQSEEIEVGKTILLNETNKDKHGHAVNSQMEESLKIFPLSNMSESKESQELFPNEEGASCPLSNEVDHGATNHEDLPWSNTIGGQNMNSKGAQNKKHQCVYREGQRKFPHRKKLLLKKRNKYYNFQFLRKFKFSIPNNATVPFNSSMFSLQRNQYKSNIYYEFILTNINLDKYRKNLLNVNYNNSNSVTKKVRAYCINFNKLKNRKKKLVRRSTSGLGEMKPSISSSASDLKRNYKNDQDRAVGYISSDNNAPLGQLHNGDASEFALEAGNNDAGILLPGASSASAVVNYTDEKNVRNANDLIDAKSANDAKNMKNINKEICVLFSRYVHNIKEQRKILTKLLHSIKNEKKKPYKYWYSIEDKMINFYINEYLKNKLNTKHTYTLSKQIVDLLKLRLLISHSSQLPNNWTEKALCNICSLGEDWEDNPIVFCDCCYTPMHSFCTGSRNIKSYNIVRRSSQNSEKNESEGPTGKQYQPVWAANSASKKNEPKKVKLNIMKSLLSDCYINFNSPISIFTTTRCGEVGAETENGHGEEEGENDKNEVSHDVEMKTPSYSDQQGNGLKVEVASQPSREAMNGGEDPYGEANKNSNSTFAGEGSTNVKIEKMDSLKNEEQDEEPILKDLLESSNTKNELQNEQSNILETGGIINTLQAYITNDTNPPATSGSGQNNANHGSAKNPEDEQWICPLCSYLRNQILFIEDSTAFKIIRNLSGPRKRKEIEYFSRCSDEFGNSSLDIKNELKEYTPPEEITIDWNHPISAIYKHKSIFLLFDIDRDLSHYKEKYNVEIKDSHDFFENVVLKNTHLYKYKIFFNCIIVNKTVIQGEGRGEGNPSSSGSTGHVIGYDQVMHTSQVNALNPEHLKMFRQEPFFINENLDDNDPDDSKENEKEKDQKGDRRRKDRNSHHSRISKRELKAKNRVRDRKGNTNKRSGTTNDVNTNGVVRKRGRPLGSTKLNKMKLLSMNNKSNSKHEDNNLEATCNSLSLNNGLLSSPSRNLNVYPFDYSTHVKSEKDCDANQYVYQNSSQAMNKSEFRYPEDTNDVDKKMGLKEKTLIAQKYFSENNADLSHFINRNFPFYENDSYDNNLLLKYNYNKNFSFIFKIPTCCICEFDSFYLGGGPIKRTNKKNQWCHIRCALISNCVINDRIELSSRERTRYKCSLCLRTNNTGIIKCNIADCYKYYHISCATSSNKYLIELNEANKLVLFCSNHSQRKAPTEILRKYQILREKEFNKNKLEDKVNMSKVFDAYILQSYLKISDMKLFNLLSLSSLSIFDKFVYFNYENYSQNLQTNMGIVDDFNDLYQAFDQHLSKERNDVVSCVSDSGRVKKKTIVPEVEATTVDNERTSTSLATAASSTTTSPDADEEQGKMFLELEEKNRTKNTAIDLFDLEMINKISAIKCNNIISISSFKNIYNENMLDEDSLLKLLTHDLLYMQKDLQELNGVILSDKYKKLKNFENILLLYPHFNDFQLRRLSELILEKYHINMANYQDDDSFFSFFLQFLSLLNNKNLMLCSVCLSKSSYSQRGRDDRKLGTRFDTYALEGGNSNITENGDPVSGTGRGTMGGNSLHDNSNYTTYGSNLREHLENKKERRLGSLSVLKKCSLCNVFICYFCCNRMNIDIIKNYLDEGVKCKLPSHPVVKARERVRNPTRSSKVGRPSKNRHKPHTDGTTNYNDNVEATDANSENKLEESVIVIDTDKLAIDPSEGPQYGEKRNGSRNGSIDIGVDVDPVGADVVAVDAVGTDSINAHAPGADAVGADAVAVPVEGDAPSVIEEEVTHNGDEPQEKRKTNDTKIADQCLSSNIEQTKEHTHDVAKRNHSDDEFVCPRCQYFQVKRRIAFCTYCPRLDGFLNCFEDKAKKELLFVHPKCLEYVNTAYSKKNNMNETKSGAIKKVCSYCRIKHGIVITCSNTDCDVSFHISCGILLGCKMDNFFGRVDIYNPKKSYCFKHTFQSCKKNTLANFINTNKLFFFENFLDYPFNHLYNFIMGTYIFKQLNKNCVNHLMKPIKIEENPCISSIFERTQLNVLRKATHLLSNDIKRSHKKKTVLDHHLDEEKIAAGIFQNEDNTSGNQGNSETFFHKDLKFLIEHHSRTPSHAKKNIEAEDPLHGENHISDLLMGRKGATDSSNLPQDKRNALQIKSDVGKNLFASSSNNGGLKNDPSFVDDNVTESAVSVLSENETEELRSFQNVSFFNSRACSHISNIVNNSFINQVKKFPPNQNMMMPYYNGANIIPNNTYPFFDAKCEDMENAQQLANLACATSNPERVPRKRDKYRKLERKRKKYLLKPNEEVPDNHLLNDASSLSVNLDINSKADGRKRRKYRKNKNGNNEENSEKPNISSNMLSAPSELINLTQISSNRTQNPSAASQFDVSMNSTTYHLNELIVSKDKHSVEKAKGTKNELVKMNQNEIKEEKPQIQEDEMIREERIYCPVCKCFYEELSDGSPADGLNWIGCDKCERWFHWICCNYSIENPPDMENDWYCSTCLNS